MTSLIFFDIKAFFDSASNVCSFLFSPVRFDQAVPAEDSVDKDFPSPSCHEAPGWDAPQKDNTATERPFSCHSASILFTYFLLIFRVGCCVRERKYDTEKDSAFML